MDKNNLNKFYFLIKFFLIIFILNFIWENLHFHLYLSNTIGIANNFLLMLYASFVDAVLILLVFVFLGLINKKFIWLINLKNLLLFSFFLIVFSIIIEERALLTNRWVYSPSMPLIGGVGLSPLVQLAVTGIGGVLIIKSKLRKNLKIN